MNKNYLAVLDACVLVGSGLRDTLLRLAEHPRLYIPKWSDGIMDEMSRTLESKLHKSPEQTKHLRSELRTAFPEAWIYGYESLESGLTNDQKDRHVLAAAIRAHAQTIVTFNLKHFKPADLKPFDIEAIHPDEFLVNQFHLDDALTTLKFTQQAEAINRSAEDLVRTFHQSRQLPLFTQTLADALSISL